MKAGGSRLLNLRHLCLDAACDCRCAGGGCRHALHVVQPDVLPHGGRRRCVPRLHDVLPHMGRGHVLGDWNGSGSDGWLERHGRL